MRGFSGFIVVGLIIPIRVRRQFAGLMIGLILDWKVLLNCKYVFFNRKNAFFKP